MKFPTKAFVLWLITYVVRKVVTRDKESKKTKAADTTKLQSIATKAKDKSSNTAQRLVSEVVLWANDYKKRNSVRQN